MILPCCALNSKVSSEMRQSRGKIGLNKHKFVEILDRLKTDMHNGKWILLGLAIYWLVTQLLFREFCATRILTGFPCPGCGMTRAAILMMTGHFSESFQMHPMVLPWFLLGLYFCFCRYILGKKAKGAAVVAVLLCCIMMLLYIYRMITIFPNQEPMTFSPAKFRLFHLLT